MMELQEHITHSSPPPEPWVGPGVEPHHHWFNAADGTRLHYVEWPGAPVDAPFLLMLHGRRAHCRWFDPVAVGLRSRFRLAALDLRAHGESESGIDSIDIDRHADDVRRFFDLFSGAPRHLLAHSMAGRLTLTACNTQGLRPDRLIMADTPLVRRPHHFHPEPPFRNKAYSNREEALLRFRLLPAGTTAHPDLLRHVAIHALRENDDGTWSWKFDDQGTSRPVGLNIPDWTELGVENIPCPTLFIRGEHSVLLDAEDAQIIAGSFPDGRVATLKGGHHHLMLDQPSAFNRMVADFLLD